MTNDGQLLAHDALAFVLAGGRGSRLKELTDDCAKPAVPFGGRSRIIDFALSNALNSGIRRIGVATQYKQASLIRHLERLSPLLAAERNGHLEVLPGSEQAGGGKHYAGTAGAVLQNIDMIERHAPRHVVILAGDHIYKMDYEQMLRQHVEAGADVTVGCIMVPQRDATGFGIMAVDQDERITAFMEKPRNPPAAPGTPGLSLASMGIYVFDTAFLLNELRRDAADPQSTHDFGSDIIPHIVRHGRAFAHRFSASCIRTDREAGDYWRDVGTLDAYFEANLDLRSGACLFEMGASNWPMWTDLLARLSGYPSFRREATSPFLLRDGFAPGASDQRSMIFDGVELGRRSSIDEAVILPSCRIGSDARLRRVIVDSGVCIPDGLVIGEDPDFDARHFRRTDGGVCLVTQTMIDRLPVRHAMRSAA